MLRLTPLALAFLATAAGQMPPPFTRELSLATPCMNGTDVLLLQHLLARSTSSPGLNITACYDAATAAATSAFQQRVLRVAPTGVVDNFTATMALTMYERDGFRDDDRPPSALGDYLYKIRVTVYHNRSRETDAELFAGNGTRLLTFRTRAHGVDVAGTDPKWPYFSSCCDGANQFSDNGNTPTGLMEMDLNSPEDDPNSFGPYPVNRAVQGLAGNAKFSVPSMRNGILVHTGAWSNFSTPPWSPPAPMPNSLGCVHGWPEMIRTVWQTLVSLGVEVRNNTNGNLPYPYKCQGLFAVQQMD